MPDKEKLKRYQKMIIAGMFVFSILINGGFFPIVNFNPENPVDLGMTTQLMIIVMAIIFHKYIGSLEAVIFTERSAIFLYAFNVLLVLSGLFCRYLLEFGEISNTYNFTMGNVLFQVVVLAAVSTIVCFLERKKVEYES